MNENMRAGIWSTWIVEDGWSRRPGQPKPKIPPYEPSQPTSIRRPDLPRVTGPVRGLTMAKLELARRIERRKTGR